MTTSHSCTRCSKMYKTKNALNKHFRKHHDPNLPLDRKGPAPTRSPAERRAYLRHYYRQNKTKIKEKRNKQAWIRRGNAIAAEAIEDVALRQKLARDATNEFLTLFHDVQHDSSLYRFEVHSWPLIESILCDVGVQVVDTALFQKIIGIHSKESFDELDPDEKKNACLFALDALDQRTRVVGRLAPLCHAMALLCTFGLDFRVDSHDEAFDNAEQHVVQVYSAADEGVRERQSDNVEEASNVQVVSSCKNSVVSPGPLLTRVKEEPVMLNEVKMLQ